MAHRSFAFFCIFLSLMLGTCSSSNYGPFRTSAVKMYGKLVILTFCNKSLGKASLLTLAPNFDIDVSLTLDGVASSIVDKSVLESGCLRWGNEASVEGSVVHQDLYIVSSLHVEGRTKRNDFITLTGNSFRWQWTNIVVVLVAVWIYFLPSPIDPKPYTYPSPLPRLEDALKKNYYLQYAERLFEGQIKGPESFAVDKNGTIYTGGSDGRLFAIKNRTLTLIGRTGIMHALCGTYDLEPACGRPKGMEVGPDGNLYIVDAYYGLLRMELTNFNIETLIGSDKGLDGIPFKFLNGLVISREGVVYFTDSSTKWDRRNHKYEVLETHQAGRVFSYNIFTGEAKTLLRGLYLANGIALSSDETFLIISEMSVARIRRLYLKGPLKGTSDVFVDNLPGYPDNIKKNTRGTFYVGMASVRFEGASPIGSFLDLVGPYPGLKRFIAKVTPLYAYNVFLPRHALVVEIDHDGRIVGSLQDPGAVKIGAVSEAFEYNSTIYIGHFESPYLGILDVSYLDSCT